MKSSLSSSVFLIILMVCFKIISTHRASRDAAESINLNTHEDEDPDVESGCHKIVKPIIYDSKLNKKFSKDKQLYPDHLTVHLPSSDEQLILELVLNKQLIGEKYFLKTQKNGINNIDKPMDSMRLCHYTGTVRDKVNSWVAVSTCDGLSGIIYDGTKTLHIEKRRNGENNEHFICDSKNMSTNKNTCGLRASESSGGNKLHRHKRDAAQNDTSLRGPSNANSASRYLELVLVVDHRKYTEMNSSIENVEQYCQSVANVVYGLYLPLNIFIALVGVVIWTEHDEIEFSEVGDTTLSKFLQYRREKLAVQHPNDNAQLITKQNFRDGVVGKALKQPICTFEYSGGITTEHSSSLSIVATTVAHMIGHNLGMEHDNETCDCPDKYCIMSAQSATSVTTRWSSCSIESVKRAFARGMDHCLRNKPKSLFKGPVCGNGFLEDGEECDCGLPEYCTNKCCNAQTCMLKANAKCGTGECCDLETCTLKKPGIICRRAATECDLSEYCTGQNEYCPHDVHKLDGEFCKDGNGHCYKGLCGAHTDQCKVLWGPTAETSHEQCYKLNMKGNRHGHCGYNFLNRTYSKCNQEDITCGALHCKRHNEGIEYGLEAVSIISYSFISFNGLVLPCRVVSVDLGLDSSDAGLVPNGAKCGEGKMCVNQKCVSVASVQEGRKCPYNCYNNGFCNSLGHCHCDAGYLLPYCQYLAPGGSVDSGPAYVFSDGVLLL